MQGQENRDHIFCDCAVTKETWAKLEFAWPQNILQSEYMEWFTWTVLNSKTKVVRIFLYAIWAIWSTRNSWVHETQKRSRAETANFIKKYIQELKDIERKELTSDQNLKSWRPPPQGFFNINFDAAFDKKEKKSCSEVIVGNPKGVVTVSKEQIHTNISSSFAAEAIACLQRTENAEAHNLASEGLKMDRQRDANHGHAMTSLIGAGNDTSKNGQVDTEAKVDRGWKRHL
ncbi:uncharacterized protein LOC108473909 [Gossypium arboreum]|uniref:uncharacterized protein LOC108473909 n=1 Tax=Gossypium arboreum TaxID=29729 RepID=UPI0008192808|nr:uncharacterized protein LOC108473909 [Gossypium arboreum]